MQSPGLDSLLPSFPAPVFRDPHLAWQYSCYLESDHLFSRYCPCVLKAVLTQNLLLPPLRFLSARIIGVYHHALPACVFVGHVYMFVCGFIYNHFPQAVEAAGRSRSKVILSYMRSHLKKKKKKLPK